jgi:hypothetical protein
MSFIASKRCTAERSEAAEGLEQGSFFDADCCSEAAPVHIKRYYPPATPYERALAHPKLSETIKRRLRKMYRGLDPVALLVEMRAAQEEPGTRISKRGAFSIACSLHLLFRVRREGAVDI